MVAGAKTSSKQSDVGPASSIIDDDLRYYFQPPGTIFYFSFFNDLRLRIDQSRFLRIDVDLILFCWTTIIVFLRLLSIYILHLTLSHSYQLDHLALHRELGIFIPGR